MSQLEVLSNKSDLANRPRSAAGSGRLASQSLGKFFQLQNMAMDEKTVNTIWKAFGSYVARQLRNGKGVAVPKFGIFTFSAANVDLAGTTNPVERDKQHRDPVFLVGKDFVSAVSLKTGIAHNRGAQLRPYDIKGVNGIIPKLKVNYIDIATQCSQNKDLAKNAVESVFRFLSDKVRRGETCQMEIPFVGLFLVRNSIAAVSFNSEIEQETKGKTARGHFVNKLFASNDNRHNLKVIDGTQAAHKTDLDILNQGGAMKLTGDAENWLKKNLNLSVQDIISQGPGSRMGNRLQSAKPDSAQSLQRYGSLRPEDLKQKSWALGGVAPEGQHLLTEQHKQLFDRMSDTRSSGGPRSRRPMSAVSVGSVASRMTTLPEVNRMKLMIIANDVYRNRNNITEVLQNQKQSLRNKLSSSEIMMVLRKVNIHVEIGNLKALLKELGFNWNGPSASFYDFFGALKSFIYGNTEEEEDKINSYFQTGVSGKNFVQVKSFDSRPMSGTVSRSSLQIVEMIKDLFYSVKKSIYDLFQEGKLGSNIDLQGFSNLVTKYSNGRVSDTDIQIAFQTVSRNKDHLTYQEFDKCFKSELPGGTQWETNAIRTLREWMFKSGFSSDTTFEHLCKIANKTLEKRLTRVDFQKAVQQAGIGFNAPQIDGLFTLLDLNQDGELDLGEWRSRIYEDSTNPLQMLREVVNGNGLTPDDLLFRMKMRIWDPPLDFPKLCEGLRRLDPTLSEPQLRHLAKVLRSRDGNVEITALLRNLCGGEHETVDFRNQIFRRIYTDIHPDREDRLVQLLEDADPLNDGRVEPQGLKAALMKVVRGIDEETIERFVRFLDKDQSGKVNYMEFVSRMAEVSNKDHNPFKSVVQRLTYFLESNNQTIASLLKRLASQKAEGFIGQGVPVQVFAGFLKTKIDKKRGLPELRKYANQMDIDKDGVISDIDIQTCISNLNTDAFFKGSGEALQQAAFSSAKKFYPSQGQALSNDRAIEICKQIRTAFINQRIAYREAFNRFDSNNDAFLSFAELSEGLDKIITLSTPIKEKLFALMDKNSIGLVDYPNFLDVIQISTAAKSIKQGSSDNFDWQNEVIQKIQTWMLTEKITVEEAFKCFDRDFDGIVSKDDLKTGLTSILGIKAEEIQPTKLDRLFRLLDFYKTNGIQLSDFQRLVHNENPYTATSGARTPSSQNFRKSLGGSFAQTSTHNWKLSAIQQVGLVISKKFPNLKDSFEEASERLQKITFEQFKRFVEEHRALTGFNLTIALIQQLFSEIDPHKKGYLTENDWNNAFQTFNWHQQIYVDLKNTVQCSFSDCDSAFEFFLSFGKQGTQQNPKRSFSQTDFEQAVNSLTANRFKKNEVQSLWKSVTDNSSIQNVDRYQFRSQFDILKYSGNSTIRSLKSAPPGARTTIYTASSSSSTWDVDIFEKLRQIIKTSPKSFEQIFREFDSDGNGTISQVEFRNAIRKLNLGLTSLEIDKLMVKLDTNADGKVDWQEFISKFKTRDLDDRLKERARDKMAHLKELMILHMTSPNDAFRFFDESKMGKLTYQEFSKLALKLHELGEENQPTYPIIKDLFDTIDIRKDGIIDLNEWQQTFGNVTEGDAKLTIRATPLAMWETTRDFKAIGTLISRNRKILKEAFEKVTTQQGKGGQKIVSFNDVKAAMLPLLQEHFKDINDEKLRVVARVAELSGANAGGPGSDYDYERLLDVYKNRHQMA